MQHPDPSKLRRTTGPTQPDGMGAWPGLGRLKLKHLDLFRLVCELGGVGRAATAAHMTQPAATKLVREVEEAFGVVLFLRDKRGMHPTPLGQALLEHVRTVLADVDGARRHLDALARGASGRVRLGVIPFVTDDLVARALARLRQQTSGLEVRVIEGSSQELLDRLRVGDLDLTLGRLTSEASVRDLGVLTLYDESFAAVAVPHHPVARARRIEWSALAGEDWVLPAQGSLSRLSIDAAFARRSLPAPRAAVECQSIIQIKAHVEHCALIGALPFTVARRLQAEGSVKVLVRELAPHVAPVSLIWREAALRSAAVRLVRLAILSLFNLDLEPSQALVRRAAGRSAHASARQHRP